MSILCVDADFNALNFLKTQEVLRLVEKTKLNSAGIGLERDANHVQSEDFIDNLVYVDFNNRGDEARYK